MSSTEEKDIKEVARILESLFPDLGRVSILGVRVHSLDRFSLERAVEFVAQSSGHLPYSLTKLQIAEAWEEGALAALNMNPEELLAKNPHR